jgi:hypothetical protein
VAELTTTALPGVLGIAGVLLGVCADRLLRHRGRVICKMEPWTARRSAARHAGVSRLVGIGALGFLEVDGQKELKPRRRRPLCNHH